MTMVKSKTLDRAAQAEHERWLLELTGLPTAAGREDRVIAWVERWVKERRGGRGDRGLALKRDRAGNLLITRSRRERASARPILITAHLDHPAFVVRRVVDGRTIELEFRGGVNDPYFEGAVIEVFDAADRAHAAKIERLDAKAKPFKRVIAQLAPAPGSEGDPGAISPGDVARWAFRGPGEQPVITDGILHAPACDDLAGVAAALAALDVLRRRAATPHVGVLLTRAEEIGFIGAIAACKLKSIPKHARLICLENSRSFAESPIGAGPIVRVGDRASVFHPALTNRISAIMTEHQKKQPEFRWQRKLMPGGTCEATTFSTFGYESTCLCLPLGNYHNMVDIDGVAAGARPAKVGPEFISASDFHGLIEMLIVSCTLMDSAKVSSMEDRMEKLIRAHGRVVGLA